MLNRKMFISVHSAFKIQHLTLYIRGPLPAVIRLFTQFHYRCGKLSNFYKGGHMSRHPDLLKRTRSGLLVIDVQEKFAPVIPDIDGITLQIVKLIRAFQLFEQPIWITEQYPAGLGSTMAPILELMQKGFKRIEKLSFSVCGVPDFIRTLRTAKKTDLILCGIEAHVCVWQSALDLMHEGFHVTVVKDAVSSRHALDRDTAFERMRIADIHLTTTETLLFELLENADDPLFKPIQSLIK
jgi:nicotinamidase-related amidase